MPKRCLAKNRNGDRCGAWAVTAKGRCPLHLDPEVAAKLGSRILVPLPAKLPVSSILGSVGAADRDHAL